jgi:thiamine kinase-like enzyme
MELNKLNSIVHNFQLEEKIIGIEPFGGGHINDTFILRPPPDDGLKFILQKINTYVFRNAVGLMSNISIVTEHIREKLKEKGHNNLDKRSLRLMKTIDGSSYFLDDENQYWRIFNFIEDHKVYDVAPNHEIAFEGARMFGQFINELSDLNPNGIVDTIPRFHDINFRMENFEIAVKKDHLSRVGQLGPEIKYVRSRYEIMSTILRLGRDGLITPRIVHNDTKINNVLFDRENKGLCVVDLDTIMPGYVHYDFGDGIRTCANTGQEDDEDLSNIEYDLQMFEAFSGGFIESVHPILNEQEIRSLAYAALLFPFIMGLRFLTDYISGDVYYKVSHPEHNIVRARAQFKLAKDGESKLSEMQSTIRKLVGSYG